VDGKDLMHFQSETSIFKIPWRSPHNHLTSLQRKTSPWGQCSVVTTVRGLKGCCLDLFRQGRVSDVTANTLEPQARLLPTRVIFPGFLSRE